MTPSTKLSRTWLTRASWAWLTSTSLASGTFLCDRCPGAADSSGGALPLALQLQIACLLHHPVLTSHRGVALFVCTVVFFRRGHRVALRGAAGRSMHLVDSWPLLLCSRPFPSPQLVRSAPRMRRTSRQSAEHTIVSWDSEGFWLVHRTIGSTIGTQNN